MRPAATLAIVGGGAAGAPQRREYFLKGRTIREIATCTSRATPLRKVVRSGTTRFTYGREIQPRPKLGEWTAELDELLASNICKPAREQPTLIRLFEELRRRGYTGGYDAVRRYARQWQGAQGPTHRGPRGGIKNSVRARSHAALPIRAVAAG